MIHKPRFPIKPEMTTSNNRPENNLYLAKHVPTPPLFTYSFNNPVKN